MKKAQNPRLKEIYLPRTGDEFDELVQKVVAAYKLPDMTHAAAVVANRIQHMPPDQCTTTLQYLGHCVLKNIAYQIAQAKSSAITHKSQIDDIVAALTADPNNQQARDAIEKAAGQGSEYAKEKLALLEPPSEVANVVQMVKPLTGEDTASLPVSPGSA